MLPMKTGSTGTPFQILLSITTILASLPVLKLEFRGYSVLAAYGAGLVALSLLFTRPRDWVQRIFSDANYAPFRLLILIHAFGLTSVLLAPTSRGLFFLLWSLFVATLAILVPHASVSRVGARIVLGWIGLYSLMVCLDQLGCTSHWSSFRFGNILQVTPPNATIDALCRPTGGYQEPNYLAAFFAIGLVFASAFRLTAASPLERRSSEGVAILLFLGIFATTSRMGFVSALAGLALFLMGMGGLSKRAIATVSVLAGVGFLAFASTSTGQYYLQSLRNLQLNRSFSDRQANMDAAIRVFRTAPFFGVGTGNAGRVLVDLDPPSQYPAYRHGSEEAGRAQTPREPLSFSLGLELLSEWGVVGFLLWAVLLTQAPLAFRDGTWTGVVRTTLALSVIAIVSTSWQTIQRLDLWMLLGWTVATTAQAGRRPDSPS